MLKQKGLYNKYTIINNDNGIVSAGDYFVLKPSKDKAARLALMLYASETENVQLACDISFWLSKIE